MSDKWVRMIATFFYSGYFPVGSGTFSSALGAYLCFVLHKNLAFYSVVLIVITLLGFLTAGRMEAIEKKKDPSSVVIDEIIGVMIAFYGLPFSSWTVILTTFFLFRAFDMFKIYPAAQLEDLGGAKGIILDDVVAGLYTNLIMQIALRWAGVL